MVQIRGSEKFRKEMARVFHEPETVEVKYICKIIPARLDGRNDEMIKFYRDFIDGQIEQGNVKMNYSKVKRLRKKNRSVAYFGFCVELKEPAIMIR